MKDLFKSYMFGPYKVRKATEKDIEDIIELLQDVARWLESKGIMQWEYLLTGEENEEIKKDIVAGRTYLVEYAGEIAATFNFSSLQNDWDIELWGKRNDLAYYIHRLAVKREFQRQQLGKKILNWIDANIQLKGGYVRLDCIANNPVLNKFYQEAGFTFVRHVGEGEDKFSTYEKSYS
ncbi:GNAT family N-acetyltransferase [Oceanobacillus bengalensis]|uniref:GNAT family N-acetyltransferase n=1 Tax=Oceanobacillus bengalensis TaxID=1435466 RepID=A0A494Z303_9BACI|nr:GNAT family N-acetyltransferase [Oceanobacillus bengalensis]RKQ16900.1 GNAT family N-acetyltransferase [Oceanobacillus bengalensis]